MPTRPMAADTTFTTPGPSVSDRLRTQTANVCFLRLLERIALQYNRANVPLMALKGAALNLTVYERSDERSMSDLDLLVRPEHVETTFGLLEAAGCLRGRPLVREDFFPKFTSETELTGGRVFPMRVDLHVRPFRPLRWARLVPPEAFWEGADTVRVGRARVLIPAAEEMLIHLAAHVALHGDPQPMWLSDIQRWIDAHAGDFDWDHFMAQVEAWRLALPVGTALGHVQGQFGEVCPAWVHRRLARSRIRWRDRLALWQAPRDAEHPVSHVAVDVFCTSGWWFTVGYLWAVLFPAREHMEEWYCHRHWGWLPCAHVLRLLSPLTRRLPAVFRGFGKVEVRRSVIHGLGLFAACDMKPGTVIAPVRGQPCGGDGPYTVQLRTPAGGLQRYRLTGKLRHLNHSCHPNAQLLGLELRALPAIRAGDELTIDYGEEACACRRRHPLERRRPAVSV